MSGDKAWRTLAPWGFSDYEVNRDGEVRRVGSDTPRVPNSEGAVGLVGDDGLKHCRAVGKLCRLAFGPKAPGATVPRAKLTPKLVAEIRSRPDAPTPLAAELDVSPSTIKAARAGQTWRGVRRKPRARYETDAAAMRAA
jgi:hypothetical protein